MTSKKKQKTSPKRNWINWITGAALTAAAGFFALQSVSTPQAQPETPASPLAAAPVETSAPADNVTDNATPAANDEPCAYNWAHQEAPELTKTFASAAHEIDSKVEARASFFGESCSYSDGRQNFLPMESNFYVRIKVNDLQNAGELGTWIFKITEAALAIPKSEIQGNYGYVEFWFWKSESVVNIIRVPIDLYLEMGRGIPPEQLYEMFSRPIPF